MLIDNEYIAIAKELKNHHESDDGMATILPIDEIGEMDVRCEMTIDTSRSGYTDLTLAICDDDGDGLGSFLEGLIATHIQTENCEYTIDDIVVLIKNVVRGLHNTYRKIRYTENSV